jgi:hypothetical protein
MKHVVFSSSDGSDAHERFQRWQAEHPGGFYINRRSASQGMLHRVGCGHVGGAGEWDSGFGDLVKRAKVCHTERGPLLEWAEGAGVTVRMCADCRP